MVLVLGHRGANATSKTSGDVYENSRKAFVEALKHGDGLETDAVRSRDGRVYLVHDTLFIDEVTYELGRHLTPQSLDILNGRRLDQLSDAEARSLTLVNGERLSDLSMLFALAANYPDAVLNIELKGEDVAQAVVEEMEVAVRLRLLRADGAIVSSFNHDQLLHMRKALPEFPIGMLYSMETQPSGYRLHPWSKTDFSEYQPFRIECLDDPIVKKIAPEFINLEENSVRAETVAAIHERLPNAKLILWYIHEPDPKQNAQLMQKLSDPAIGPHVYAIISHAPRAMKAALRHNGFGGR